MHEPLIALLDCHYRGEQRPWKHGALEIQLGRQFNAELCAALAADGAEVVRWSSDALAPRSVTESHRAKVDWVCGHNPRIDLVLEVHFNNCPPARRGFLVEFGKGRAQAQQLAELLSSAVRHATLSDCLVLALPAPGYVTSKLFWDLEQREVPFVLLELGNLNRDDLREDYLGRAQDSVWCELVLEVADALVTWQQANAQPNAVDTPTKVV